MAEKRTDVARTEEKGLARREAIPVGSPFRMLERFAEEMDRVVRRLRRRTRMAQPASGIWLAAPVDWPRGKAGFPTSKCSSATTSW